MYWSRAVAKILSTQKLRSAGENLPTNSSAGCVSCLLVIVIPFMIACVFMCSMSSPSYFRLGANSLSLNS